MSSTTSRPSGEAPVVGSLAEDDVFKDCPSKSELDALINQIRNDPASRSDWDVSEIMLFVARFINFACGFLQARPSS